MTITNTGNTVFSARLIPAGATLENGEYTEYQIGESSEIEGAEGWDNIESFLFSYLDDSEIVENPSFAIHGAPENAVITTPDSESEGHGKEFEIFWMA